LTFSSENILLVVQYDGTDFFGSQIQPGKRTVQGTLKETIKEIFGIEVHLLFASRTDRGVHATHNVCTFKPKIFRSGTRFADIVQLDRLPDILNEHLPEDLRVVHARAVPKGFHPRYMAIRRDYQYRIFLSRRDDIRYQRFSVRIPDELDLGTMRLAASLFKGKRDFTPFAVSTSEIKDPICELYELKLIRKNRFLIVKISANRFLRKMACKIVGALVQVGRGECSIDKIRNALEGKKPDRPFLDMPGKGLTLVNIVYPEDVLS